MEKLLISFSGGETSGYMLYFLTQLWEKRNDVEMKVVFANTGEENEETLIFVDKVAKAFNIDVVWVEALVSMEKGEGTKHKIVTFKTASRNGEPFEDVIRKYGIPNQAFPHCNREMKLKPIHSYIKSLGWKDYHTAIGIRSDEFDRMTKDYKKNRIYYPLIKDKPMSKQKINFWWEQQPFRLNLKGYQGNCKTCWKKSFRFLHQIANEHPEYFDFFKRMEDKYGKITPLERDKVLNEDGTKKMMTFFRGGKTVDELLNEAKNQIHPVRDANGVMNYQIDMFDDSESCDIFSNCGD